jgi:hypothetical protein
LEEEKDKNRSNIEHSTGFLIAEVSLTKVIHPLYNFETARSNTTTSGFATAGLEIGMLYIQFSISSHRHKSILIAPYW